MAAKGAPPVAGRVGRPLLLYATALSWVLLAGVCSVQYLAGRTQLMPVRCQSALVLQPAAVVGAAAAAAAERQEAPDAAQQEQPGLVLTPGKRQPVTKSAEQQQLLGEQLEQPAAAASARAGGHGDGGDSSTSSSDGGDSSSSGAGATHAAGGSSSDASGSAASSRLPASWRDVDALIQAPSPLHGLQKKGGLPNRWPVLVGHMTNRDADHHGLPAEMTEEMYDWFARARTFNHSAGLSNAGLQSPVPACHFWVDHKYRIVYVRNTKTAGTSIAVSLGMKENPYVCKIDPPACYEKCVDRQVCLQYMWDPEEIRRTFAEYTVFTFVRNPWARAISSWKHIHNRGLQPECRRRFADFAQLPSTYGALCLAKKACCTQRFGWILEHIEPQAQCLFDCDGNPSVDFIGRTEHLEEDMQELIELINRRRPMGTPILKHVPLPRLMVGDEGFSESGDLAAMRRSYAELYFNSSTAFDDIYSYHQSDFEMLKFPDSLAALRRQKGSGDSDRADGAAQQ